VGLTSDVAARGRAQCGAERIDRAMEAWVVDACVEFCTEQLAVHFEKYLESGWGHSFAARHFR
jgi:hypothetical protein